MLPCYLKCLKNIESKDPSFEDQKRENNAFI